MPSPIVTGNAASNGWLTFFYLCGSFQKCIYYAVKHPSKPSIYIYTHRERERERVKVILKSEFWIDCGVWITMEFEKVEPVYLLVLALGSGENSTLNRTNILGYASGYQRNLLWNFLGAIALISGIWDHSRDLKSSECQGVNERVSFNSLMNPILSAHVAIASDSQSSILKGDYTFLRAHLGIHNLWRLLGLHVSERVHAFG